MSWTANCTAKDGVQSNTYIFTHKCEDVGMLQLCSINKHPQQANDTHIASQTYTYVLYRHAEVRNSLWMWCNFEGKCWRQMLFQMLSHAYYRYIHNKMKCNVCNVGIHLFSVATLSGSGSEWIQWPSQEHWVHSTSGTYAGWNTSPLEHQCRQSTNLKV